MLSRTEPNFVLCSNVCSISLDSLCEISSITLDIDFTCVSVLFDTLNFFPFNAR